MANSLQHDGKIDTAECSGLIKKLDGHDAKLKEDIIAAFVDKIFASGYAYCWCCHDTAIEL